jgi:hypothetical protein
MWALFLPTVAVMHHLRRDGAPKNGRYVAYGIVVFITVLAKCLFNGYEYITASLVMMVVPAVYYSILERLTFRRFLMGSLTAALSSLLAIVLSMGILCFQIASVTGSLRDGVLHIVYSLQKRTYADARGFPAVYAPSLESSTTAVVTKYLKGTFFDVGNHVSGSIRSDSRTSLEIGYSDLLVLFFAASVLWYPLGNRYASEREARGRLALISATWFSILAPLSWFVVFKAHSFIHTHMNYVVWQMPFTFFGFAVCGSASKSFLSNLVAVARGQAA